MRTRPLSLPAPNKNWTRLLRHNVTLQQSTVSSYRVSHRQRIMQQGFTKTEMPITPSLFFFIFYYYIFFSVYMFNVNLATQMWFAGLITCGFRGYTFSDPPPPLYRSYTELLAVVANCYRTLFLHILSSCIFLRWMATSGIGLLIKSCA